VTVIKTKKPRQEKSCRGLVRILQVSLMGLTVGSGD
jgi:hypothetical protein